MERLSFFFPPFLVGQREGGMFGGWGPPPPLAESV